jgi:hypothetical protein
MHTYFWLKDLKDRVQLGKRSESQRPVGKSRCKWEDIKLDLETGLETVDCICFVEDMEQWLALVNLVMNREVP